MSPFPLATKALDPRSPSLRFDIVAGLVAAAVVLPKAMAYATVAGLPVAVGLYTAFTPMVIYALLGSSRVLSVSSTTTLAILTGYATRPGRPRRRSGEALDGDCGAHRAGRGDAGGGAADAPGIRRQLHFHARADGLQGRHRPRDRPGPGAEAPRDSHHEGRIRPRSVRHRAAPARPLR